MQCVLNVDRRLHVSKKQSERIPAHESDHVIWKNASSQDTHQI